MMTRKSPLLRQHAVRYVLLSLLFAFVMLYQLRASLETVHLQRTLDFYIPFLVTPFTSRVGVNNGALNWEQGRQSDSCAGGYSMLRRGDEILEVNGRKFDGMAVYLQQLWEVQHRPPPEPPTFDWKPFVVTVRGSDTKVRNIEFGFPHCTCGIPTLWEAVALWTIAPTFCFLIGFATVALRPSSTLAWAYLGIMLSLSQLQMWDEPYAGFQLTVSPMVWPDWMRVPAVGYRSFVQHAWPAALLLASMRIIAVRPGARWFTNTLVASFLAVAILRAVLDIAWSESFRTLAPLHRLLEDYRTELILVSLISVAALALTVDLRFGSAVGVIAITAATSLYRSAAPITKGEWINYSDETRRFELITPALHHTPELIILVAVSTSLAVGTIALRRTLPWQPVAGLLLLLPLAAHAAASFGNYGWYPFAEPFEYWRWFMLISAGGGLVCIARWIVRPGEQP